MTNGPKKRITFKEAAKRLKEIRQQPLDPALVDRLNELMEKSEQEQKEEERKNPNRKIARGDDLEGAL
jgi:HD-GYP domain-containing protein (c-di-GMP phosphodiesterase class II)